MGGRREHQVSYDDWKTTPPDEEPPPRCPTCDEYECRCPDEPTTREEFAVYNDMTEIEKLRHLANISGDVRESLWDGLTRAEILRVCDAWMASGWDFYPDQWTPQQLSDAIRYGITPAWDPKTERPITHELRSQGELEALIYDTRTLAAEQAERLAQFDRDFSAGIGAPPMQLTPIHGATTPRFLKLKPLAPAGYGAEWKSAARELSPTGVYKVERIYDDLGERHAQLMGAMTDHVLAIFDEVKP